MATKILTGVGALKNGATKKPITVVGIMMLGIYLVLSTTLLYTSVKEDIVSER